MMLTKHGIEVIAFLPNVQSPICKLCHKNVHTIRKSPFHYEEDTIFGRGAKSHRLVNGAHTILQGAVAVKPKLVFDVSVLFHLLCVVALQRYETCPKEQKLFLSD